MCLVQLGVGTAAFVYTGVSGAQHVALLTAITIPSLLNAAVGLFTNGTVIYHVAPPSPSKEQETKTQ